ncbi:hypothetical protein HFP71_20480 [Streptomyces sp. ARC32]
MIRATARWTGGAPAPGAVSVRGRPESARATVGSAGASADASAPGAAEGRWVEGSSVPPVPPVPGLWCADTARWTGAPAGGEGRGEGRGDGADGGVAVRPVGRAPAPVPAPDAGPEPGDDARCTGRPDVPPSAVRGARPAAPGPTAGAGAGRGEGDVGRDGVRCTGGPSFAAPEADPAFVPDPDPDAGAVGSAAGDAVGAGEPVALESGGGVAPPSVGRAARWTGVAGPTGAPDAGAGLVCGVVRGAGEPVALPSVGRAARCTGVPGPAGVPVAGAVASAAGEVRGAGPGLVCGAVRGAVRGAGEPVALPSVGRAARCTGVPGPPGVPEAGAVRSPA